MNWTEMSSKTVRGVLGFYGLIQWRLPITVRASAGQFVFSLSWYFAEVCVFEYQSGASLLNGL